MITSSVRTLHDSAINRSKILSCCFYCRDRGYFLEQLHSLSCDFWRGYTSINNRYLKDVSVNIQHPQFPVWLHNKECSDAAHSYNRNKKGIILGAKQFIVTIQKKKKKKTKTKFSISWQCMCMWHAPLMFLMKLPVLRYVSTLT